MNPLRMVTKSGMRDHVMDTFTSSSLDINQRLIRPGHESPPCTTNFVILVVSMQNAATALAAAAAARGRLVHWAACLHKLEM